MAHAPIVTFAEDGFRTRWYGARAVVSWQTVVISLGAAFLTGTAAVLVAVLNIRAQRRQQLQTRRVEAASDFSKRFTGATDALRYALEHSDDEGARHNASHLVGEVTPLLGPLSLLFGDGSTVAREGTAALRKLEAARDALGAGDLQRAEAAAAASRDHRVGFESAARKVVG